MAIMPDPALHDRLKAELRGIVPYDTAHLPELADLWVGSWRETMPAIDFEARRGWFVDHLVAAVAAGQAVRLAMTGTGDVAGFVMVDPKSGYLDQICVGPWWWGGGMARALLDEARRLSPHGLVLDVNADNRRAVAFYAREGFVEIGRGRNERSGLPTLKLAWSPGGPAPGARDTAADRAGAGGMP
jgi:putative acetyltransferase